MHSLGSERSSESFSGMALSPDVSGGNVDSGISEGSDEANQ
jgi:hypothetical protein